MSSARPPAKPVSRPVIGLVLTATAATSSSTRSGAVPPGSGSRFTTVSWTTTATKSATGRAATTSAFRHGDGSLANWPLTGRPRITARLTC